MNMKKCEYCGTWSPYGFPSCPQCGASLDYTLEMSAPKFIIRDGAKPNYDMRNGVITMEHEREKQKAWAYMMKRIDDRQQERIEVSRERYLNGNFDVDEHSKVIAKFMRE